MTRDLGSRIGFTFLYVFLLLLVGEVANRFIVHENMKAYRAGSQALYQAQLRASHLPYWTLGDNVYWTSQSTTTTIEMKGGRWATIFTTVPGDTPHPPAMSRVPGIEEGTES